MGRKSKRDEMRFRIATACRDVLADEGVGATTMVKVAERAGVATSLIHHHFENREDLFAEVLSLLFEELPQPKENLAESFFELLKLPKIRIRRRARAWTGILAEAIQNTKVQALLRTHLHKNLMLIETQLDEYGVSTEEKRQYAASLVSFVLGAFLFDAILPQYSPGFAAPGILRLFESLEKPHSNREH